MGDRRLTTATTTRPLRATVVQGAPGPAIYSPAWWHAQAARCLRRRVRRARRLAREQGPHGG